MQTILFDIRVHALFALPAYLKSAVSLLAARMTVISLHMFS